MRLIRPQSERHSCGDCEMRFSKGCTSSLANTSSFISTTWSCLIELGGMFARRIVSEGVGTALLLAAVVGSGIMGERLSGGNVAIALLANTLATGAALVALILTFGPISGAHFNPVVTLADAAEGGLAWADVPGYVAAQILGAFAGVAAANVMFELPL